MYHAVQLPLGLYFLFTAQAKAVQPFITTDVAEHGLTAMDGGNATYAGAISCLRLTCDGCRYFFLFHCPRGFSSSRCS